MLTSNDYKLIIIKRGSVMKKKKKVFSKKKYLYGVLVLSLIAAIGIVYFFSSYAASFYFSKLNVAYVTTDADDNNILAASGYLKTATGKPVKGAYVSMYLCDKDKKCLLRRFSAKTSSTGYFKNSQVSLKDAACPGYVKFSFNGMVRYIYHMYCA